MTPQTGPRYRPSVGSPEAILGVFSKEKDGVRLIDAHEFERQLVAAIRYANERDLATTILACVLPVIENQPTRDPGGTP